MPREQGREGLVLKHTVIGAAMGAVIGLLLGNLGVGVAIGAGIGLLLGFRFHGPGKKRDEP